MNNRNFHPPEVKENCWNVLALIAFCTTVMSHRGKSRHSGLIESLSCQGKNDHALAKGLTPR